MTDTPTTMSMLLEHQLFTIEKLLDEYPDVPNIIPKIAWKRLLSDYRTLQARLDQAHWDAISRDQTIENLRAENERLREALRQVCNWADAYPEDFFLFAEPDWIKARVVLRWKGASDE